MVSSSFKISHKPTISLNSLPEELLVEISSYVASYSLSDIHNLEQVSKSFQYLCNDQYILRRVPLHDIPLFPWSNNPEKIYNFFKFFKRFRKNGNPEALYRKGFVDYFHKNSDEQKRNRGLKRLAEAADKGNQEAQYVYGLILICLGSETKQKGFKILSSLLKPTMIEMDKFRSKIRDYILWHNKPMMRQLKRSYVRESCNCDGPTDMFFVTSSSVCEICLWHRELQLLFHSTEE